ncbi:hypothetical protein PVAG01_03142 [Phlyctema vagabunda]|uniref:N-acetyltransferase domain-containing protein n=1 Tax=Phlyctema vagabunda TaxID=108571 RepID=A0ABR4PU01_9HELO
MPAMIDDPTAATIYRTSGTEPFPDPLDANPALPADLLPRQVTLRDRVTTATVVPFSSRHQVPASLLVYLCDQFNKEIEDGNTYPMYDTMTTEKFSSYWFQNFGAVMLLGNISSPSEVVEGKDWSTECLGSFYVKPNYPGRCSHICNAGFLVTDAARGRGVGRLMGETYLEYGPKLGYTYSVFNLVFETNVASCRIWDALGFKRIGRVKGAGNLRSYPGQLIDAIIYGRDLGKEESEEFVSEERFDKIKFYLRTGKYPAGADRAEKSRLRSAATHYKLVPGENGNGEMEGDDGGEGGEKLMLKDKEVISDPKRQYEIARATHVQNSHGGINKTTATIAERYHWVRIKETVSLVIKNCAECRELGKQQQPPPNQSQLFSQHQPAQVFHQHQNPMHSPPDVSAPSKNAILSHTSAFSPSSNAHVHSHQVHHQTHAHLPQQQAYHHSVSVSPQLLNRSLPPSQDPDHEQSYHHLPLGSQIMPHHDDHDAYLSNQGFVSAAAAAAVAASASQQQQQQDQEHERFTNSILNDEVLGEDDQRDLDMLIDHGDDEEDEEGDGKERWGRGFGAG